MGETHAESSGSITDSLNDKELPVVELLTQGYKNHVIAHELFVSVRTVELRHEYLPQSRSEVPIRVAGPRPGEQSELRRRLRRSTGGCGSRPEEPVDSSATRKPL